MEEEKLRRIRKDNRIKAVVGLFLLLAVGFFVWRHVELDGLPFVGMVISESSKECIEIKGPQVMTDTVVRPLEIEDLGFEVIRDKNRAVITVKNIDEEYGEVKVRVYCKNGNEQGRETKRIFAGSEEIFIFEDVNDCDLEYMIEPELLSKRVNKTVYVEDVVCE